MNSHGILYYLHNYRFKSMLMSNFIRIFLLLIIPLVIVSLVVYQNMSTTIINEINTNSISSLNRFRDMTDTVFKEVDLIATNISVDPDVELYMMSAKYYDLKDNIKNNIGKTAQNYTKIYKYIDSIYVYSMKNDSIISNTENSTLYKFSDNSWYDEFERSNDKDSWVQLRRKFDFYPYYISVVKPVFQYGSEKAGAVIINIDIETLGEIIDNEDSRDIGNLFILDKMNKIVYNGDRNNFGQSIFNIDWFNDIYIENDDFSILKNIHNQQYIICATNSQYMHWKYISFIPVRFFSQKFSVIRGFILGLFILSILLSFGFSMMISIHTFEPIKEIMKILENPKQFTDGKLEEKQEENEFRYIVSSIVRIIYSSEFLKNELKNQLALLDKAHTVALQTQINPHFLYNTLEAINWTAYRELKGKNDVSSMIMNLSHILRLSLDGEEGLISMSREIEHSEYYIKIMQFRYGDSFKVHWDIDDDIRNYKTVRLILQPLLENSISHGFKSNPCDGVIKISGKMAGDDVEIDIWDNGVGLSEEKVENLNNTLKNKYQLSGKHIGVYNVNQRIKLVFGEKYGININSLEGQYTLVKIIFPVRQ